MEITTTLHSRKLIKNSSYRSLAPASLVSLPVFLFLPFGALITIARLTWNQRGLNKKQAQNVLIFFIAAYIGLIHSSREIIGDQIEYLYFFEMARKEDIATYLKLAPEREYIYWIGTYIFSNAIPLSSQFFFFFIGFIGNFALTKSTQMVLSDLEIGHRSSILIILITAFSADIFVWSMHLIRQNLAYSLAMIALAYIFAKKRNITASIVISFIALFIHNSSIFILAIGYLVYLLSRNKLLLIPSLIIIPILYISFENIIDLLNTLGTTYVNRGIYGADSTDIDASTWYLPQIILWLMTLTSIATLFRKNTIQIGVYAGFIPTYLIFIYLMLGVSQLQLLSYRLLTTVYFMFPFFIPICIKTLDSLKNSAIHKKLNYILPGFAFLWIVRFFYSASDSYGYPNSIILLANPLIIFI